MQFACIHVCRLALLLSSNQDAHTPSQHSTWGVPTVLACALVLCNRVFCESVCRLCPLIVTDIVDEDMFVHGFGCLKLNYTHTVTKSDLERIYSFATKMGKTHYGDEQILSEHDRHERVYGGREGRMYASALDINLWECAYSNSSGTRVFVKLKRKVECPPSKSQSICL